MLLSIAGAGFRLRVKRRQTAVALAETVSRPGAGCAGLVIRQRLQAPAGAQAIDVALSQDRSQPGREAAASVEVPEQGAFEQFAVDTVGEVAGTAGGVERVGGAI